MAVLGDSKLEAVTHMMAAAGRRAPASLDPGGSSEEAFAEQILDQHIRAVQTEGYHANQRHKTYSSGTDVTVGSDVLRLVCVAPGRYAGNIVLKGDVLYCATEDTNVLSADAHCIIWVEMTWDQCPPEIKSQVLAKATKDYVARLKQRQDLMAILEEQAADADKNTNRPPMPDYIPPNRSPSAIAGINPQNG